MKLKVKIFKLGAQEFINFSNIWWEDYKSIRPSHSNRLVKLYVPTEDREN